MAYVFNTATTVNGFLADPHDSLAWLFAVPGEAPSLEDFMAGVTLVVMGSTTYEWVLRHEDVLANPEKWDGFFGDKPCIVFTSRRLQVPAGANVRLVDGPVAEHLPALNELAGSGTVWIVGGGDLAGQFLDAGALDEVVVQVAPTFLAAGRPLFTRDLLPDRLSLEAVERVGQFAVLRYAVRPPAAHSSSST